MDEKILVVNQKAGWFGGVESYIYKTGKLLAGNGYELTGLFAERVGNDPKFLEIFSHVEFPETPDYETVLDKLRDSGIKKALIHKVDDCNLIEALTSRFQCACIVHDHDYYCMRHHKYFPVKRKNCHLPFNMLYCSACSMLLERAPEKRFGVKMICPFEFKRRLRLLKECSVAVVLSDFMRDNLVKNGFAKDRVMKLYPFIDAPELTEAGRRRKLDDDPDKILFVGQLIRGKGVDLLLDALEYLDHDFRLTIVGKGNDTDYLKDIVRERLLDEKVKFAGFVEDVDKEYQDAAVVAVPSRWQEPFGLVGPEAFSRGKPVVGFNVGGIGEWLHNGENGFLAEEKDLRGFAAAIDELLENSAKAVELGRNGYNMVKEEMNREQFLRGMSNILGRLEK